MTSYAVGFRFTENLLQTHAVQHTVQPLNRVVGAKHGLAFRCTTLTLKVTRKHCCVLTNNLNNVLNRAIALAALHWDCILGSNNPLASTKRSRHSYLIKPQIKRTLICYKSTIAQARSKLQSFVCRFFMGYYDMPRPPQLGTFRFRVLGLGSIKIQPVSVRKHRMTTSNGCPDHSVSRACNATATPHGGLGAQREARFPSDQ